jgi:hypothetical protein
MADSLLDIIVVGGGIEGLFVRHLQRVGLGPEVERRGARVGFKSEYFRAITEPRSLLCR